MVLRRCDGNVSYHLQEKIGYRFRMNMEAQDQDEMLEDDFSYETRLVVLNFMSLLPREAGFLQSSGTLNSSGSSAETQNHPAVPTPSDPSNLDETLPTLPESTLAERVTGMDIGDNGENQLDSLLNTAQPSYGVDEPDMHISRSQNRKRRDVFLQDSGDSPDSPLPPKCSPQPEKKGTSRNLKHQFSTTSAASDMTDTSDISLMMSMRSTGSSANSYIDIQHTDVSPLVKRGILPPQALPLQNQLNQEMDQVRKTSCSKSVSPVKESAPEATPPAASFSRTPLVASNSVVTPQSEVAEQLRQIGDSVQAMHGREVEHAFNSMMSLPQDQLSYEAMERILLELISHIPGISQQAAVVLLLSQKLAMYGRDLHRLVNYTVRFFMDKMASYIITHGGWSSILGLDDLPVVSEIISPDQVDSEPLCTAPTKEAPAPENDITESTEATDSGLPFDSPSNDVIPSPVTRFTLPEGSPSEGFPHAETLEGISNLPLDEGVNLAAQIVPEETSTTDVTKVTKAQARLVRQISDKFTEDSERECYRTNMLQNVGMITLGSAIIICTSLIIYRKFIRK